MDIDQFFDYFMIGFPIFMVTMMACAFARSIRRHRRMMDDMFLRASASANRPRPGHGPSSNGSHGYGSYDHGAGSYTDSHYGSSSDSSSYSSSSCDTSSSSSSSSSDSSSSSC